MVIHSIGLVLGVKILTVAQIRTVLLVDCDKEEEPNTQYNKLLLQCTMRMKKDREN